MQKQASQIVARSSDKKVAVGEFRDAANTMERHSPGQDIHLEFMQAIETLETEGDPLPLETYLRSERPLGRQERKILAAVFHRRYASKGGRSPDSLLRIAATLACAFYDAWRELNRKIGVRDRGHSLEMKDYAARVMTEIWLPWKTDEPFVEAVRELMDRPRQRRDPGNLSLIAYENKVALIASEGVDFIRPAPRCPSKIPP
jgi:hypothetical protein